MLEHINEEGDLEFSDLWIDRKKDMEQAIKWLRQELVRIRLKSHNSRDSYFQFFKDTLIIFGTMEKKTQHYFARALRSPVGKILQLKCCRLD